MSMDLSVWSECAITLPSDLPQASAWVSYPSEFAFEAEGWHLLVMESHEDEPEPAVLEKVPDARIAYFITLEPIGAGPDGYKFLEEVTRALAYKCGGVWVDPNGESYFYNEGSFE